MAIQDYLNNDFEKFAAEAGATIDNAVENTDESIEKANKRAELRTRIDSLKNKIANLENQRKIALEQKEKLKVQRESLTDDEIVRMAKVKGIKDEDIAAYINGRSSQRSAKNEEERLQLMKDQVAGQKVANELEDLKRIQAKDIEDARAKNENINKLTVMLDEYVQKISDYNVDIVEGDNAAKAKASNAKKSAMNRFNELKEEYKKETGKDWTTEPAEYTRPAETPSAEPANEEDPIAKKPKEWTWSDYGAWLDADAKGKERIEAKYKDKKDSKKRADAEKEKRIASNTEKGKATNSWVTAKSYASDVADDIEGKTWSQIMMEWGWNLETKKKGN